MAKTEVTVIMPGMAAIVAQAINRDAIPPYLTKLIDKSRLIPNETGLSRCMFNHFSQSPLVGSDLPMMDISSETDITSEQAQGFTIKADPCYLHPDRDRLLLFSKGLDLTEQESVELIAEVQPLLYDLGVLSLQSADSWTLTLAEQSNIDFSALDEVEGKTVESNLPSGEDRRQWVTLWNEIQMQLYNADVNTRRVDNKQLPINSLWFWGQGTFEPMQDNWTSITGQSPLLAQLVDKTGQGSQYTPNDITPEFSRASKGRHLRLLEELNTELDWQTQLQALDTNVFEPLWRQLSKMAINKLVLQVPEFGEYHLTPLSRWRFWT
jgi:hypothetical protein